MVFTHGAAEASEFGGFDTGSDDHGDLGEKIERVETDTNITLTVTKSY
jgi:hypothetical protein